MSIRRILARQIFDSCGNPTVEVDLTTDKGVFRGSVPNGASTGIYGPLDLRDGDKEKYHGRGVTKAVNNINSMIGPKLIEKGFSCTQQIEIDELMLSMDGTEKRSKLGANSVLGVSLAVCKAGAAEKGIPLYQHIADLAGNKNIILPVPAFDMITRCASHDDKLSMQVFMILPTGASSFTEAMKMGTEVYHHLKAVIKSQFGLHLGTTVGDMGGFVLNILQDVRDALELVVKAIQNAGYAGKIEIAIDMVASDFYKEGKYDIDFFKKSKRDSTNWITSDELVDIYNGLVKKYPIASIEDPFDQDDWQGWVKLTASLPILIVGDDLIASNPNRIQTAIDKKACNSLLLKRIGSVTQCIQAVNLVKSNGWRTIVSHRSGETEDTFIADLAVGLSTGQIKAGAPCRSERIAKYNQLLRIEQEMGSNAVYAGKNFRHPQ